MQDRTVAHSPAGIEVVGTNKVLKNTYMLLAMTLAFSAFTAFLARGAAPLNPWVFLGGFIGLSFLAQMLANSAWGLLAVFGFTGFVGYAIGPLIGALTQSSVGSELVMQALGGTAVIFLGLSAYAITTKKDFSFLAGFITAGAIVLLLGVVAVLVFKMPALHLALSAGFMLFSSALILFQTGQIVNGGERNYILATITLYASIYNLFISLLHILMALSGDD
ncbi:Bax inhibitor-1/YccA family protein [Litorivivens sp.]|uniref:Bax inhibitor-1/YccA family protein n=1 Tax=Litorivivens sp. TaxID=2020868 RepID=UPI003569B875